MTEVKRYWPAEVLTDRWEMGSMDEAADGGYVEWDDYEDLLAKYSAMLAAAPQQGGELIDELSMMAQMLGERDPADELSLLLFRAVGALRLAAASQVPTAWNKAKPSRPGAYSVRNFRLGEPDSRPALVEVDFDEAGVLVSNMNERNSDDDMRQWSPIADHADRFEWFGPLAAQGGAE